MNDVRPTGAHQAADLNEAVASSTTHTRNEASSVVIWLVACSLCVGVLAMAAAPAPARIRLLGLFSIGFGLLVGWLTVRLAQVFEVRPAHRIIIALASSLALVGFVAITWQTFQLDELTLKKSKEQELAASLMREFDRQQGVMNPTEIPLSSLQRFRGYLARRVRELGEWPSPWPEVFWCGELLAASMAAGWFALRLVSVPSRQQPESGVVT